MPYSRARRPVMIGGRKNGGLAQRKHRPDYALVIVIALLMALGLMLIYSISPGLAVTRNVSEQFYVQKQMIAIVVGIAAFIGAAYIPLKYIKKYHKTIIISAIGLTFIALALPVSEQYQAHRWVRLGGFSLQTVEVVKLALIVSVPMFLVNQIRKGLLNDFHKTLKPLALVCAVFGALIVGFQSDLGSALVLVVMVAAIALIAGIHLRYIFLAIIIVAFGVFIAITTSQYRRDRFLSFLNPNQNCQTTSYQACQALVTVGSGGLIGQGIGQGVQAYGYLPEAANDSIFAIHAEKFGFIGSVMLVLLYAVLFSRIKSIVERAPDVFSRLVAVGVLAWISTQALMNIGAMIGVIPLKGITLPLVSYGGTSMMLMLAALGIVFNISRYTTYSSNQELDNESVNDNHSDRRRHGRSRYTVARRSA